MRYHYSHNTMITFKEINQNQVYDYVAEELKLLCMTTWDIKW